MFFYDLQLFVDIEHVSQIVSADGSNLSLFMKVILNIGFELLEHFWVWGCF